MASLPRAGVGASAGNRLTKAQLPNAARIADCTFWARDKTTKPRSDPSGLGLLIRSSLGIPMPKLHGCAMTCRTDTAECWGDRLRPSK